METTVSSGEKITKLEVWEIVESNFEELFVSSFEGLFYRLRKRELIGWGEWYYLHEVLDKCKKSGSKIHYEPKLFIESIIKKIKENAENKINKEND